MFIRFCWLVLANRWYAQINVFRAWHETEVLFFDDSFEYNDFDINLTRLSALAFANAVTTVPCRVVFSVLTC